MVSDSSDKREIQEIALQTIMYADKEQKGSLNFQEFKNFFNSVIQISI